MAETTGDREVVRPARTMRTGDRIVVEPIIGPNFEATVLMCLGWGLAHGVMDWQMRRDDGTQFVYGIALDAPVRFAHPVCGES